MIDDWIKGYRLPRGRYEERVIIEEMASLCGSFSWAWHPEPYSFIFNLGFGGQSLPLRYVISE